IGQHRLVGRLENPQFAAGCARQDHKQQFHDLFGRNDGQIHLYTRSPSLKNQKTPFALYTLQARLSRTFAAVLKIRLDKPRPVRYDTYYKMQRTGVRFALLLQRAGVGCKSGRAGKEAVAWEQAR